MKQYELGTITVTATRLDQKFAKTRSVTVLDRSQIEQLPAQSVAQMLNHALGVSMNSRGIPGVVTDPSLRGAGFEQVLILLDGVRMNNSQTGHHTMNLPVSVQDIERIEVLRGQSSALYGPDAFGGVINIITRSAARDQVRIGLRGGSFGTFSASGSVSFPKSGSFSSALSFENTRSDGYREDTDFIHNSVSLKSEYRADRGRVTMFAGYAGKDFGANDFYVRGFDHYEEIDALTAGLKGVMNFSERLSAKVNVNYGRTDDYFELSRTNPQLYTAEHTTNRTIIEASGTYSSGRWGDLTVGLETTLEDISSTTLGSHDVYRHSLFGEYGRALGNDLLLDAGIRVDDHKAWGTEVNPSLGLGYVVSPDCMLRTSVGRSFRAPTFTELYSPAASKNIGDPYLRPETAVAYDAGIEYRFGSSGDNSRITGSTVFFVRDQSETIDWIRDEAGSDWRAVNIFDILSRGIEQELRLNLSADFSVGMNYTYLHQDKKQEGFTSKYLFMHPRHQLVVSPSWNISQGLSIAPVVTYKDRPGLNESWVVDLAVSYDYRKLRFFVEGMNLTGADYQEIRDVPMPGAAVYAGIQFVY